MVGELNASHTGSRFSGRVTTGDNTASLGLYYDHTHRGPGMRVAEVLPGGPSYQAGSRIAPGATILKVDGVDISADMDIYPLLNRKEGRQVTLTIRPAGSSTIVEETVTPVSLDRESQLAYERWVDKRRAMTDKLSSARVGYLHIAAMGLPDFQRFFSELFGELADKEAVVIDVRFNLGGNLHDQLIAALTGEPLGRLRTNQGVFISTVPSTRWTKPSAVIANAMSYSDGSVFPFFYQRQGIGPVVGERVPGTGTAVWWESQQESRLTYGVPQLGFQGLQGRWLENQEIVPDVLVYNDPDSVERGRDLQLEAAVKVLLDRLGASMTQQR
jgi:tricorn protease